MAVALLLLPWPCVPRAHRQQPEPLATFGGARPDTAESGRVVRPGPLLPRTPPAALDERSTTHFRLLAAACESGGWQVRPDRAAAATRSPCKTSAPKPGTVGGGEVAVRIGEVDGCSLRCRVEAQRTTVRPTLPPCVGRAAWVSIVVGVTWASGAVPKRPARRIFQNLCTYSGGAPHLFPTLSLSLSLSGGRRRGHGLLASDVARIRVRLPSKA